MKKNILLAFDFDGTLVSSHAEVLAALKHSCEKMGREIPSPELLRKTSARELVKILKLRPWNVWRMLRYARDYLRDSTREVFLYPGMKELLQSLDLNKFEVHVVSTNSVAKIEETLKREKVFDVFSGIEGDLGLWSKSKVLFALQKKTRASQALYVGDEERDIICAENAGFASVAVGWGFKDADFLKPYSPRYFVDSIAQFEALLKVL